MLSRTEQCRQAIKASCRRGGYDRLAPWYELLESVRFGGELQAARIRLLEELPRSKTALFVGDGDGRLLEAFTRAQPTCRVISLDLSQRMLELQAQRISGSDSEDRVQFVRADSVLPPIAEASVDLLVTAFHLDCFDDSALNLVIERLGKAIKANGMWYVVDFVVPDRGWRRVHAKFWLFVMIRSFQILTGLTAERLPDHREAMNALGWETRHESLDKLGWISSMLLRRRDVSQALGDDDG